MNRPVPVLTVVTPVFNAREHIVRCLDNVRDQARPDVEHLVIDGGSTDGTVELIRERMEVDDRVRLLTGRDRGQSHAMNMGVMIARGDILGCLNVDDWYYPGTLDIAIDALATSPEPSFLWGACDVDDQLEGREWVQRPGRFVTWRLLLGWDIEPHPVNPCAYFYHRSLHFRAGMFEESEHFALDVDFLVRASMHVASVITVEQVLGKYVMAPGTKTYTDTSSGQSRLRLRRRLQQYVGQLPPLARFRYEVARARWR